MMDVKVKQRVIIRILSRLRQNNINKWRYWTLVITSVIVHSSTSCMDIIRQNTKQKTSFVARCFENEKNVRVAHGDVWWVASKIDESPCIIRWASSSNCNSVYKRVFIKNAILIHLVLNYQSIQLKTFSNVHLPIFGCCTIYRVTEMVGYYI